MVISVQPMMTLSAAVFATQAFGLGHIRRLGGLGDDTLAQFFVDDAVDHVAAGRIGHNRLADRICSASRPL